MSDRVIAVVAAVAATVGALLHAAKGLILITSGDDLSFVPAMITAFAVGLAGFALLLIRLEDTVWARAARNVSVVTIAAGIASIGYQIDGTAPEDAGAPDGVKLAYALGTLGVLVALLAIGIATARSERLPGPLRIVPLVAALVWFPFEGLTEVLPDGWGLLLAGLAWLPIGYCIWGTLRTVEPKAPATSPP